VLYKRGKEDRNTRFSKKWRSLENVRISYCSTPNFLACARPSAVIDLIPTWNRLMS